MATPTHIFMKHDMNRIVRRIYLLLYQGTVLGIGLLHANGHADTNICLLFTGAAALWPPTWLPACLLLSHTPESAAQQSFVKGSDRPFSNLQQRGERLCSNKPPHGRISDHLARQPSLNPASPITAAVVRSALLPGTNALTDHILCAFPIYCLCTGYLPTFESWPKTQQCYFARTPGNSAGFFMLKMPTSHKLFNKQYRYDCLCNQTDL